mmetsp:Transcript_16977/g.26405  ORF Transcript_16977/g.26405 Transcript_16977/m.26405 type:complete len:242 (-) Transcript_16977:628-1353(-)
MRFLIHFQQHRVKNGASALCNQLVIDHAQRVHLACKKFIHVLVQQRGVTIERHKHARIQTALVDKPIAGRAIIAKRHTAIIRCGSGSSTCIARRRRKRFTASGSRHKLTHIRMINFTLPVANQSATFRTRRIFRVTTIFRVVRVAIGIVRKSAITVHHRHRATIARRDLVGQRIKRAAQTASKAAKAWRRMNVERVVHAYTRAMTLQVKLELALRVDGQSDIDTRRRGLRVRDQEATSGAD